MWQGRKQKDARFHPVFGKRNYRGNAGILRNKTYFTLVKLKIHLLHLSILV